MKRGFSLLEVLVTLGILALLFAVILPNFSYVQDKKEKMKMEEMTTNLLRARRLALEGHVPIQAQFKRENYGLYKKSTCLFSEDYGESLQLISEEAGIRFTSTGRPDNTARSLIFKGKRKAYRLIVAPVTGQVRWEVDNEERF